MRALKLANPDPRVHSPDAAIMRAVIRRWREVRAELSLTRLAGLDGPPHPPRPDVFHVHPRRAA